MRWRLLLRRINRRVFVQYFLSFFLLLVLLFTFYSLSGLRSQNALKEECRRSNTLQASRFASLFDGLMENSSSTLLLLEKNFDFIYTVSSELQQQPLDSRQLYRVRSLLALTKQTSQADLFVYYGNSDIVLPAEHSIIDSDYYYNVYYRQGKQSFEEWLSLLDGSTTMRLATVYHEGEPCLAMIRALPTSRIHGSSIVAVSVFRSATLLSFMQDAQSVEGAVAIYDANQQLLLSSNPLAEQFTIPDELPVDGYLTAKHNGKTYYVSIIPSNTALCRYVSFTPVDVLTASVIRVQRFQLLASAVLLVMGLLLSLYLARRNARPVEDAVKLLSVKTNSHWNAHSESELEYLRNTIEYMLDEKQYIQQAFDLRSASFQQTFLYEAVFGMLKTSDSLFSLFARNRLPLISDRFAIVLLRGWHEESIPSTLIKKLIEYTREINGLCHPLFLTSPACTCVLNLPNEASLEDLNMLCLRFRNDHSYIMCRSDIFSGLDGLSKAFEQAKLLAEYDIVYDNTIVLTPELPDIGRTDFAFLPTFQTVAETELSKAIQTGDNLDDLMNRLRQAYSTDGARIPRSVRCFMYDMRRALSAAITRQCSTAFAASLKIDGVFLTCESYVEFSRQALMLLELAHKHYAENHLNNALCVQVLTYLEEHYNDPSIGVGTLDKTFGVSSAILSERFRRHTGQSISDYLTQVRVIRTRQLLSETDMTLEEIAASVGIVDSSRLIRLFKKLEGITPGAYRKAHRGIQQ